MRCIPLPLQIYAGARAPIMQPWGSRSEAVTPYQLRKVVPGGFPGMAVRLRARPSPLGRKEKHMRQFIKDALVWIILGIWVILLIIPTFFGNWPLGF